MTGVETCEHCGFEIPLFRDRCPHCARPSRFPNVIQAGMQEEKDALEIRYQAARNEAGKRRVESLVQQFEDAVAKQSRAVIGRSWEEINRLAGSEKELYATFYSLVSAGVRIPDNSQWDQYRGRVDEALFPYYKQHIRFAALSLDDKGLINYGACFLILRDDMIAYRAVVFEENSILFMKKNKIGLTQPLPTGYRAVWGDREKLAVAKLSGSIDSSTTSNDFIHILLKNGTGAGDDEFVEVHIYGSISIRTVEKVSIIRSEGQKGARFRALQENLNKYNVALVVN